MSISTTKDNSEDFFETAIDKVEENANQAQKNKSFNKKNANGRFVNIFYKLIDKLNTSIIESKKERKLNKVYEICLNYEKNMINEKSTYRKLLAKQKFSKEIFPKIREVLPVCEEEDLLLLIIRVCAITNRQKKERPERASEIMQIMNEADQRYHLLYDERNHSSDKKGRINFSNNVVVHEIESNKNNQKRFRAEKQNSPKEVGMAIPTIEALSDHLNKGLSKVNKCSYHPAVLLFEDCIKDFPVKKMSKDEYKQQLQKHYFSQLDRTRLKIEEAEVCEPLTLLDKEQTKKAKMNFKRLIESPLFDQWIDAQA